MRSQFFKKGNKGSKNSDSFGVLLLLICSVLIVVITKLSEASTTVTLAGSYGNTEDSYYFPLFGSNIHVATLNGDDANPIIYVSDSTFCVVRQIIGNSSRIVAGNGDCGISKVDSVPGTSCMLNSPAGVYYDEPNNFLYILDHSSIRLLDMTSGIISKMVISFSEQIISSFNNPSVITMYNGDLYVADTGNVLIWKVKITYRNVGSATIALGSLNTLDNNYCNVIQATSCKLIKPTSVSFFPDGTMVVSDSNRIIMVGTNHLAYAAPISSTISPTQTIAYDQSNMLISDGISSLFLLFNKDQKQTTTVLNYNSLNYFGIVKRKDGSKQVYFLTKTDSKTYRNKVVTFSFNENNLPATTANPIYGLYDSFSFNSPHNAIHTYLSSPQQIRLTQGNDMYFPVFNSAVVKVNLNTGLVTRVAGSISQFGYNQDNIPATIALLMRPNTVIQLDSGDIIISDTGNNRIRKIDSNGIISTIVGNGNQGNSGDNGPANQATLNGPQGLAAPPPSMAGQFIFDFADSDNHVIRRLNNDLTVVTVVSDGMRGPNGIFYTPNGDLYIANQSKNQIVKYSNSKVTVVAGSGQSGYSGDGGLAIYAQLSLPSDVTVSSTGEVYIADWGNQVVRKVFTNGTIITFVNTDNGFGNQLNGVTMTPNDDLIFSTRLTVSLLLSGNSGTCVDKFSCNNHGNCLNGKCVCDSGWRGNLNCGAFSCDVPKPLHALSCIGPNQFSCISGWTGDSCENPICFGTPSTSSTVCTSHGQCISNNTCECDSGWRGSSDCSLFSCDIESEHGTNCIGPNTYQCQDGWIGNLCDVPLCDGIPATSLSVCHSHGQCISNNTCNCFTGWRGNSICTQFTCDGVNNCLPHGNCISNNTCKCSDGYGGIGCNDRSCFGQWGQAGCNNNGNCANTNKCSCFSLYFGDKCEWIDCDPSSNDLSINSTKGCSSNGQCTVIVDSKTLLNSTICKCNTGFDGKFCQEKAGNGGTVAAVVICLLIFFCFLFAILGIAAFVIYRRRKGYSKSEEYENLIPSTFDSLSMSTALNPGITEKSSVSSYRSTNSSQKSGAAVSFNNNRDHFHIREKEYVKSKKLGSGASGQVFMFEELTQNEQVAVKIIEVLNPNGSEFKEVVNMFELSEEANPHIAPILGCTMVENGGYICIIMPLYKCDLRNWVYSNRNSIPIELIVEIVRQIASALQYLHSKNMVHRDLKQTNIFVSKSPDLSKKSKKFDVSSFELCVGDWGSSRSQNRSNLTAYEGTIQYSSPESIVKGEFSAKSDVWSLGCILYQLLSSDYNSCLMQMKQTTMNDDVDVELLNNIEKNYSSRSEITSHKLYKLCCDLLLEMIHYDPEKRIVTDEILNKLKL